MVTRRPSSKIYSRKAPIFENFVPRKFPIPIVIASMNPERDCEAEAGYSENYIAAL